MDITLSTALNKKSNITIVPVFEDASFPKIGPPNLKKILAALKKSKEFEGKTGQKLVITPFATQLEKRMMLIGLGKHKKVTPADIRNAVAGAVSIVKKFNQRDINFLLSHDLYKYGQEIGEGLTLANYNPAKYVTGKNKRENEKMDLRKVVMVVAKNDEKVRKALKKGLIIGQEVNNTRDYINAPNNMLDGEKMVARAKEIAKNYGLKVTVLNKKQLEKLGMGALLGVNKGSPIGANLIFLEHKPKSTSSKAPIAIVGKGITFDSGGYDLKPSGHIKDMKQDMSGAGVVLGIMALCSRLEIDKYVIGVMPVTDNLIGPDAQKTDDIISTYNGMTVEIGNTDAEGRLILADALAYTIDEYKPEVIIDLATLTGACAYALGERYCGLFGNDDGLIEDLRQAGEETDELAWPLPIHPDHTKAMKGKIADLSNISSSPGAGASTAAAFLKAFVGKTTWAHLDIAGVAFVKEPKKYEAPMGTGYGVRLLANYLED
ncbi:leucyl aminopeptidase [Pseudomonadota bacterium]